MLACRRPADTGASVSSLQANLPGLPTTLLIGGEVALRFQNELEGAGFATGVVETGAEAVHAVREGGYHAVIVPAVLPDMSSYDFCMSLLRHVQGVFVVLYGAMDAVYAEALRQTGRVAHVTGFGHESVAHLLAARFGVTLPSPPPVPSAPSTPTSGSALPFGGSRGGEPDLRERVARLEEDLGVAESELDEARARLQQADDTLQRRLGEMRSLEKRLGDSVEEVADLRVQLEGARRAAERAGKERDGLKALVDSLEEDRRELERKLEALPALEREKDSLERMVQDLTRKLAAKSAGPRTEDAALESALGTLAPLTWDMVQAAEWLEMNDAPKDHVRALRVAVRSIETLLEAARAQGLLKR